MNSTINRAAGPASTPARRLQTTCAAVRLSFTWLGSRKTLSREQRQQAAETFDAEGGILSAAKKLLDTRHPAFSRVTGIRSRAISYWRGVTLPYPEPGIRLIRQDRIESFDRQIKELKAELHEAVGDLDRSYEELKGRARERLGRLYDPRDYPDSLQGLFDLEWDFPSLSPPQYLLELKPELYEQEVGRIAARFDEAVTLAEEAFGAEFSKLLAHLAERLAGTEDGKPKVFRDSAVDNVRAFFQRFGELNIRSNEQLDELVEQGQRILQGVDAQALREREPLRQRISTELAKVQASLDQVLVERPRRKILRSGAGGAGGARAGAAA